MTADCGKYHYHVKAAMSAMFESETFPCVSGPSTSGAHISTMTSVLGPSIILVSMISVTMTPLAYAYRSTVTA